MKEKTMLTPHFSLEEMVRSTSHPEITNKPTPLQVENLTRVCQWLEKMREMYNQAHRTNDGKEQPVKISSGFRSKMLNRAVGGVNDSNHLDGNAADIICRDCKQALEYAFILLILFRKAGQEFDELFIERKGVRFWVHFAVREFNNRGKCSVYDG